ncbi:NADH dehydrogenase [ubiquinone] iron-sulfur protein 6, mitochondrial [Zea mays]|uniref:NADH dehydrogenase [ubiquinone] iron-sulfur protein 6, mitochondrial n=1 Tax=Zea mays TaxID=4577 RepID=A0A3L6E2J9_MAIZE|nr:NADH dehydrogenase [ubiquinone] iron-sulfur protein 6, mitochondrial [Zea mays]
MPKDKKSECEAKHIYISGHTVWFLPHASQLDGRIAVCEGAAEGAGLGRPIEYICLDLEAPNVCKYCGLRYVQIHHH